MIPEDTVKNVASDFKDSSKSSSGCRYVMTLKSIFDRELFPNEFDIWTEQEQCEWINKNITILFSNVPKSLLDFIPAYFCGIIEEDCDQSPIKIPEWLDMNKYRRGQKFVRENYASLIIVKILGLMHVYSFEDFLRPLIISKRTQIPLAFKRYRTSKLLWVNFSRNHLLCAIYNIFIFIFFLCTFYPHNIVRYYANFLT